MTGYVVGFLVAPETDEVLLIRKNRPAWQAGLLNGPGGHVEPGESAMDAMRREFWEEAGLEAPWWTKMLLMHLPAADIWFFRWRCAPSFLRQAESRTDEPVEVWRIADLLQPGAPIVPNLRWLLPLAAYQDDRYDPFTVVAQKSGVSGRQAAA